MGIGSHLLTKENLELVGKNSWKFGRPQIIEIGMRYYDAHPDEAELVARNLAHFDLPCTGDALDETLRELVVHYYEKLFVLTKGYEAFWVASNRIEMGDSLRHFEEARGAGKAVFIGQSHFGATYLMASALMVHGINLATVGKFPEPVRSMLNKTINSMAEKHNTGRASLLSVDDPTIDVPTEMITRLLGRQVVSNVFDENNQFCRPVELLGKRIMGGTGMDLILNKFGDDKMVVVTPFLVRTSEETFRYEVDRHYLKDGNIIENFFKSLEKRVREHFAQWYFIHEVHENFVD